MYQAYRTYVERRVTVSVSDYRDHEASFPDPQKAMEDLHAFAKLNEGRLYKLLKTCMDTQVDLKSLVKSTVSSSTECQSPGADDTM